MTPNLGAGGNAAIESASALANSLSKLTDPNPSLEEVRKALSEFYVKRHARVNTICNSANELTRIEALSTLPDKNMALYAIPVLGDFLSDITCDSMVGAELLETLPAPPKSLTATMPWNPESGVGKHVKKWLRALYALPLLLIWYGCSQTMGLSTVSAIPYFVNAAKTGYLTWVMEEWYRCVRSFLASKASINSFRCMSRLLRRVSVVSILRAECR
jgi:hypothetical protein